MTIPAWSSPLQFGLALFLVYPELGIHAVAVDYLVGNAFLVHQGEGVEAKAHTGQVDKGGAPYILHPIRVMLACEGEKEKIVALLHDTLEDTALTAADLRRAGFSEEIVQAVCCLTRGQKEDYMDYIARICENVLAARVKYADLQDNLDISRIPNPTEKDFARIRKYEQAMKRITRSIKGGREHGALDTGTL